jgi:hypothetical protein
MTNTQTWRNVLSSADFCAIPDVPSDTTQALQPQYSHAERFTALADFIHEELDATPEIEDLIRDVADPATAHGVFLDWLGDRVGAARVLQMDGGSVLLEDEDYRFLIMLKALRNISAEGTSVINSLLSRLLSVPVWVIDHQDMTIDVRILGEVSATQAAILRTYGVPNRPAGVRARISIIDPSKGYLGFYGSGLHPFDQGIFYEFDQIFEG